jgi:hypothetical protein
MKKAQINFEVTEEKTLVTVIDLSGGKHETDITGTDVEKHFKSLLRKLSKYQVANAILKSIDINTFQEITTQQP